MGDHRQKYLKQYKEAVSGGAEPARQPLLIDRELVWKPLRQSSKGGMDMIAMSLGYNAKLK